jgi:inosine-uridine nucleoside N-ribohydrolase
MEQTLMETSVRLLLAAAIALSGMAANGGGVSTSTAAGGRQQMGHTSETVKVIFDTDIGPDCDDAGALAILNVMADRGEAEILAVGHCTSNLWGAPCADAINHYYGRTTVPLGTLKTRGFLDKEEYHSYNRHVAQTYPNRFAAAPDDVPDVVGVYRSVLSAARDGSVTFVAVGPLCNLAALLDSKPDEVSSLSGAELVRAKVARAVIMGGRFPREGEVTTQPLMEWNLEMHPAAAMQVAKSWPTEIVFSGFEVGCDVITGLRLINDGPASSPVRDSYRLYPHARQGRSSWDLTAAHYAVRPNSPLWKIAGPGRVDVNTSGGTTWTPGSAGKHFILRLNASVQDVANELDDMLLCSPKSIGRAKP